eukprot:1184151-Prorocentrum_minimum.AAC.5
MRRRSPAARGTWASIAPRTASGAKLGAPARSCGRRRTPNATEIAKKMRTRRSAPATSRVRALPLGLGADAKPLASPLTTGKFNPPLVFRARREESAQDENRSLSPRYFFRFITTEERSVALD